MSPSSQPMDGQDFIGAEVHAAARAKWGRDPQIVALIEELCEAAAAGARFLNGKGDAAKLLEELVDVESLRLSIKDDLGDEEAWRVMQQDKRRKLLFKLVNNVRRVEE